MLAPSTLTLNFLTYLSNDVFKKEFNKNVERTNLNIFYVSSLLPLRNTIRSLLINNKQI